MYTIFKGVRKESATVWVEVNQQRIAFIIKNTENVTQSNMNFINQLFKHRY